MLNYLVPQSTTTSVPECSEEFRNSAPNCGRTRSKSFSDLKSTDAGVNSSPAIPASQQAQEMVRLDDTVNSGWGTCDLGEHQVVPNAALGRTPNREETIQDRDSRGPSKQRI
ncbi:hypothetical protein KQX54_016657 [Cotesia glomerata]|uniref:Uncharacterized protein n=1 Tax=Cotesia glomerata TaxID=32391 RepID=A0AAV7I3G8_COTGL|nr:hypothetical protein KQX54_016657 [Cotesia glomerata]